MKRQGLLTDRQVLIRWLERETGIKANYSGAPSFRYCIGPYTVLRDGTLATKDEQADEELLMRMENEGLIGREDHASLFISFPAGSCQGKELVNLINMLSARGALLNKAIGVPNAFHMSAELVRILNKEKPYTKKEFMDCVHRCGGVKATRGVLITQEKILFPGFPVTDECRQLGECIIRASIKQRWSKPKTAKVENEKYSFRVWLNAIGMKGPAYKEARALLLRRLDGDPSFRTTEQKETFYEKRRRAAQPEFITL